MQEFSQQLERDFSNDPERLWVIDFTSALAKFEDNDVKGALGDFHTAADKNPERSEFYYYYGLALLENEQEKLAVEQFKTALAHEPELEMLNNILN